MSVDVAESVTEIPETVVLSEGEVTEIVGAVVSGTALVVNEESVDVPVPAEFCAKA